MTNFDSRPPKLWRDMFDDNLSGSLIGFDDLFENISSLAFDKASNYPPYNIVENSDTSITIEVALAGFKREDVDVTVEDGNLLRISGEKEKTEDSGNRNYRHRGISSRKFSKTFCLSDNWEVEGAEFDNGVLNVSIKQIANVGPSVQRIDIKST